MDRGKKNYRIVLSKGINFHTLKNFKSIYDNFFLPFYITKMHDYTFESFARKKAAFVMENGKPCFFAEIHRDELPGGDEYLL